MAGRLDDPRPRPLPPILDGLRVLDLSHQYSGALAAGLLADLGADVICVEHPSRTAIRTMLPRKGEHSLWWKVIQRGKRVITLDLSKPRGRELALQLASQVDVIAENFRPGTLERWGLGPEDLEAAGLSLVMLRISGLGQTGPERSRPGFGTIAEAMSGFANLNGEPDGSPTFPSSTLADGVAATFGAFGIMAALWNRVRGVHRSTGVEVVDVALFEGLFRIIPTQIAAYDQLGHVAMRPGNKLTSHGVLRNLFQSRDGRWFVVSAVGPAAIGRVLAAAGATAQISRLAAGVMLAEPDVVIAFLDECDELFGRWAAEHDYDTLAAELAEADAVYQLVYTAEDIMGDRQFQAREDLIAVPDEALGPITMQGIIPKFPKRSHVVRRAGPERGADNVEVFGKLLDIDEDALTALRDDGIV